MMLACEKYLNIWPTPTMKTRAWNEFLTCYLSNGFGHKNWDSLVHGFSGGADYYKYMAKIMTPHLSKMQVYTGPEVISWFNFQKERSE